MSDDDFEDEATLDDDDLDEEVLDDDFVDEEDVFDEDDDEELTEGEEIDSELIDVVAVPGVLVQPSEGEGEEEDDDVVDLDEELHPDDVEEALDVVLRERTVAAGLEDDEEDDEEPDDRGEAGTKIVPRRENEFLCKSCFLVLPLHQLADPKRMICRDCA